MTFEIVQVIQELSTAGGAEGVAWELATAFGRAKLTSTVIASAVGGSVCKKIAVERVVPWLSRIPTRGMLRHVGRAIVVPLFTLAATLALRRHRNSVVISHGDSLAGDVLVVHAVNAENLAQKRRNGSWWWLLNPLHLWVGLRDRWMIGGLRYRMFVAVSARVSTELQKHYGVPAARIRVIPNGVDLSRFRIDRTDGRLIRQEFGIPMEAKLLLFVGHEFRRKGLAHAIEALDRLGDDVWLLVVGSDNPAPYRKLAKRARGRLVFAGARRDMPALYSAADAFVLPTGYETFSLVCMEAMASGIPVFAPAVGGIEDYLKDGINGYVVAFDAADIAGKIARTFADKELYERMRVGARRTAEAYAWDAVASMYLQLVSEIKAAKDGRGPSAAPLPPAARANEAAALDTAGMAPDPSNMTDGGRMPTEAKLAGKAA